MTDHSTPQAEPQDGFLRCTFPGCDIVVGLKKKGGPKGPFRGHCSKHNEPYKRAAAMRFQ